MHTSTQPIHPHLHSTTAAPCEQVPSAGLHAEADSLVSAMRVTLQLQE